MDETPSGRFPYRPQFYPAADTAAAAQAIEVGTAIVRLPPMVMRSPLAHTTITAEIVCRDGTRAIRGVVVASNLVGSAAPDRSGTEAVGGRFIVHVIPGPRYRVDGSVEMRQRLPDGSTVTTWKSTNAVLVDTAPPPVVRLEADLDRCGDAGGAIAPHR